MRFHTTFHLGDAVTLPTPYRPLNMHIGTAIITLLLLPERTNLISCCIIKLNNELPIYLKYCRRVRTTMKRVAKLKSPYARIVYMPGNIVSRTEGYYCVYVYAYSEQSKVWTGKWASYCFTSQSSSATRAYCFSIEFLINNGAAKRV